MLIVTIDSGTTNTRVRVWREQKSIAEGRAAVGVRDVAKSGNQDVLIQGIKLAIQQALSSINASFDSVQLMIASGMITSNVGLCEVPHLRTPVSLHTLARNLVPCVIEQISTQPIWFIPGVRNDVFSDNIVDIEMMDVMRGEEVETFGLLSQCPVEGPALIVLPGSHTKFVHVDAEKNIVSCATTLAGELLDVLTHQTLLTPSLQGEFASSIERDFLQQGADTCRQVGIARSCFSVRMLDLFSSATQNQKANFLLGAALSSDLLALRQSQALQIPSDITLLISGKPIMQEALAWLIESDPYFTGEVIRFREDPSRPLAGYGAIEVMQAGNPFLEQPLSARA